MKSHAVDSFNAKPRLQIAAIEFEILPDLGTAIDVRTGGVAVEIVGPLKTTVMLLDDDRSRVCLVTTHFGPSIPVNVSDLFRRTMAQSLGIPPTHVLLFSSHNHCSPPLAKNGVLRYEAYARDIPEAELLPVGEQLFRSLQEAARQLPSQLVPVRVEWSEGHQDGITYERKARRPDGTSYMMREEDRVLLGPDFRGDIDPQAPLVLFRDLEGKVVAGLTQFTGHPVTSYHPERNVIFGEWPQVACDQLSRYLAPSADRPVPIGFLQGCAADVNSKEMFVGGVSRSTEFGARLAASYIAAIEKRQLSRRDGIDLSVESVPLPLAPLPPRSKIVEELREMEDFIARAHAGDENTRLCVGLNFPTGLSPRFRARLVELVKPWNEWALAHHEKGSANEIATELVMEVSVLRIGDVGIVGMPCEPFQGIGRQIRQASPLPLAIPCGYTNLSHGYITDSSNTGDNEYMSAHHRYTRYRLPLRQPAGDVLAARATESLRRMSHG